MKNQSLQKYIDRINQIDPDLKGISLDAEGRNSISLEDLAEFAPYLSKSAITHFSLDLDAIEGGGGFMPIDGDTTSDKAIQILASYLKVSCLRSLCIRGSRFFTKEGFQTLASILIESNIQDLSINYMILKNENIKILASSFPRSKLLYLVLDHNNIENKEISTLAPFLLDSPIVSLTMQHQKFGDAGVKALVPYVKQGDVLYLDLNSNELTGESIDILGPHLKKVRRLDLWGNPKIKNNSLQKLAAYLKNSLIIELWAICRTDQIGMFDFDASYDDTFKTFILSLDKSPILYFDWYESRYSSRNSDFFSEGWMRRSRLQSKFEEILERNRTAGQAIQAACAQNDVVTLSSQLKANPAFLYFGNYEDGQKNLFHIAASVGSVPIIEFLLSQMSAKRIQYFVNQKDKNNFTPIDIAKHNFDLDIVRLIQKYSFIQPIQQSVSSFFNFSDLTKMLSGEEASISVPQTVKAEEKKSVAIKKPKPTKNTKSSTPKTLSPKENQSDNSVKVSKQPPAPVTLSSSVPTKDPIEKTTPKKITKVITSKKLTHNPAEKSWYFDQSIFPIHIEPGKEYKLVKGGPTDIKKVVELYQKYPVPGYDIKDVQVVYNPKLGRSFSLFMDKLQQREGKPAFQPKWHQENDPQWREQVIRIFKELAEPFKDSDYPAVNLIPTWHATSPQAADNIFAGGFASLANTDEGFFGKGLYSTDAAEYANRVYGKGALIVTFVAGFSAYPVIKDDMNKLKGGPHYQNYDIHFVPVVPKNPNNPNEVVYIPCSQPDQNYVYLEIVSFDSASLWPAYSVTLQLQMAPQPTNEFLVPGESEYKQAHQLCLEKKFQEAYNIFLKSAAKKYPPAYLRIAALLKPESKDKWYQKAVEELPWFTEQALTQDASAQNNLGICYEKGLKNFKMAKLYYELAANKNYLEAKKNLKNLLQNHPELNSKPQSSNLLISASGNVATEAKEDKGASYTNFNFP